MNGKTYLQNPYLKELKGRVIYKEKKDDKYHIILDRTIFFPRFIKSKNIDKGTINGINVIDVFTNKDGIVHVVKENISSKDVVMKIDWNIRFDYMQQHTGKHILSASINKLYGANTLEFKFDEKHSYLDINFKELNNLDINRIEKFANHIIYSNFQIKSDIEKQDGKENRIVSIDNMDSTNCEGVHCSSTGEVGIIKIINFKKNDIGNIKLKFVCGNRALKDYAFKHDIVEKLSNELDVGNLNLYEKIKELLKINQENTKASDS